MSTTNNNDTDNIVTIDDLSEDITLNQTMLIFKVTLAFVESDKDNIDNKPEGLRERLISFVTSHEDREKVPEWGSFCADATLIVRSGARLGKSGVLLGRSDGLPIYMSYSAASAAMLGAASAAMVSVRDTTNH